VEILRVHADQKGLELSAVVEATVPPTVETDAVRFRQMLLNLLGNAVKFTEQGSVSVRTRYSSSDSTLTVEISDTGIGIPAAAIDRVFQPFHQADSSVVRRHGGTGLGLSIVKRFAVLLGGDVTVTSQPGSGSTFTLTIIAPAVADREPRGFRRSEDLLQLVGRIERRCWSAAERHTDPAGRGRAGQSAADQFPASQDRSDGDHRRGRAAGPGPCSPRRQRV
jgi:anti-sigma regulatory factor (Ser/Thr protein kinase)